MQPGLNGEKGTLHWVSVCCTWIYVCYIMSEFSPWLMLMDAIYEYVRWSHNSRSVVSSTCSLVTPLFQVTMKHSHLICCELLFTHCWKVKKNNNNKKLYFSVHGWYWPHTTGHKEEKLASVPHKAASNIQTTQKLSPVAKKVAYLVQQIILSLPPPPQKKKN